MAKSIDRAKGTSSSSPKTGSPRRTTTTRSVSRSISPTHSRTAAKAASPTGSKPGSRISSSPSSPSRVQKLHQGVGARTARVVAEEDEDEDEDDTDEGTTSAKSTSSALLEASSTEPTITTQARVVDRSSSIAQPGPARPPSASPVCSASPTGSKPIFRTTTPLSSPSRIQKPRRSSPTRRSGQRQPCERKSREPPSRPTRPSCAHPARPSPLRPRPHAIAPPPSTRYQLSATHKMAKEAAPKKAKKPGVKKEPSPIERAFSSEKMKAVMMGRIIAKGGIREVGAKKMLRSLVGVGLGVKGCGGVVGEEEREGEKV